MPARPPVWVDFRCPALGYLTGQTAVELEDAGAFLAGFG